MNALIAGLLLVAATAAAAAPPAPRDAVLARIDADSVTVKDLVTLLASLPRPRPDAPDVPVMDPDRVLRRLIQNRLLEEEGYRIGAQDDPMVRNQVWELKRHRAMIALMDSVAAEVPSGDDPALGAALDRESVMQRVSHILVDGESFARALIDSLAAGVSFEELSRRHSRDTARAATGGDLGWARADLYVPAFQAALEGLSPGEIAGPVASDQGWHVLKLTETRTETAGQSDAMRAQVQEAAHRERVMQRMRDYVEELKAKYGVVLEDSVVARLDYGSSDPEVARRLHDSREVVARLPWTELTVADLTRRLRFEHFHGLEGKPDAAHARDKGFQEWVTELLLRHEAVERGFDRKPAIVAAANQLERDAIREVVIKMILDRPFDPAPEDVERFWREHADAFTPVPRVRAQAAVLADEESARRFREKVDAGADVAWLAGRADGVKDAAPAAFSGWMTAASLGIADDDLRVGTVVGPFPTEDGWAVLEVAAVEPVAPEPLESCRKRVVSMMTNRRSDEIVRDAIARLEAQADIRIEDGARDQVALWIDDWAGTSTTPRAE